MPRRASKSRRATPARRKGERRRATPARRKGERRRLKVDPRQIVFIDEQGIHTGLPERRSGKDRRRSGRRRDRS
ncbi:MAG: hypothetical protein HYT86_01135 [candidate division NC10 bacterium]|nr:hypothetical protein [candidate division NC10 bacterium]